MCKNLYRSAGGSKRNAQEPEFKVSIAKGCVSVVQMIPLLPCLLPWHSERIYPKHLTSLGSLQISATAYNKEGSGPSPVVIYRAELCSDNSFSSYRSSIWPRKIESGSNWQDQSPSWKMEMESKPIFTEKMSYYNTGNSNINSWSKLFQFLINYRTLLLGLFPT